MKDSVGQDHRGRYVLSEGSTKEVRLDPTRQECTLCCQGEVHRKTPRIISESNKKRRESLPRRKVPEHMNSEGIKTPLNGYQWAVKKPVLMGKAEPVEAPVKLQSFRLERRKFGDWMLEKIRQCSPHRGKGGKLWDHNRTGGASGLMSWSGGSRYKASEKKKKGLKE